MVIMLRLRLSIYLVLSLFCLVLSPTLAHAEAPTTAQGDALSRHAMIAGPDGSLWSADPTRDEIIKVSPSSATSQVFPVSGRPTSLVVGLDGNLWFTEFDGNKIGQIAPTGAVREFPIPTASSAPSSIVVGPDGNLWFTEYVGNKIGRISSVGAITEFALPTSNSKPDEISVGIDGALWFNQRDSNRVGRISTDGAISEVAVARVKKAAAATACSPLTTPLSDLNINANWSGDGTTTPFSNKQPTATVPYPVSIVIAVTGVAVCLGTFKVFAQRDGATQQDELGSIPVNSGVDENTPITVSLDLKFPSAGVYPQFFAHFVQGTANDDTTIREIFPGGGATVGAFSGGGGGGGGCTTGDGSSTDLVLPVMLLITGLNAWRRIVRRRAR